MKRKSGILAMIGLLLGFSGWAFGEARNAWPFDVTDLRNREKLVILVFGDGGYRRCRSVSCRPGHV